MKLIGPERYELVFSRRRFELTTPEGTREVSDRTRVSRPKLYVVVSRRQIVYVGITNRPIRARLRYGWTADGKHGYHGYAWRRKLRSATLFVWYHPKPDWEAASPELETIEAEVVYAIRWRGQWPKHQTEIHFHPSRPIHRWAAQEIVKRVTALARRPQSSRSCAVQ